MATRKEICIDARFIRPQMDGIGRYLINIIRSMNEILSENVNVRFTILEMEEYANSSSLREFDDSPNIRFVKIPIKPLTIVNNLMFKYLRNFKFDLYHYPQFDLPHFINVPSVVTIHDLNPQIYSDFFEYNIINFKRIYSKMTYVSAISRARSVISVSESTKTDIVTLYGKKYLNKINVIYEGVDQRFLNSPVVNNTGLLDELKRRYNFDKFLLYVGNNRPHKNLENMLKAFKVITEKYTSEYKFILSGFHKKNRFTDIQTYAAQLGIENSVIQLESTEEELLALYKAAEILMFCSLSEGFGFPILEAMAMGTPVVTSNLSSMKEIGKDSAQLVDPYNFMSISNGIQNILNNPSFKKELILKGKMRAEEFSWRKCGEKTLELYLRNIN